jgi:PPK2 family polyphosphate:nucleotide phosphotransferase
MKIDIKQFLVPEAGNIKLNEWPTRVAPLYESKKAYKKLLKAQVVKLSAQQQLQYADDQYSLLLVFQAMDAAGKDGAIKHVMSGINPQGCQVFSFKQPSATELDHDFLWRTTKCLPERGRIGIFNRSYYEEVLVVRVHPEYLSAQKLPGDLSDTDTIWQQRYQSITDHENHLHRNGTRIVKFFLHLSEEEQRKRFVARIDKPEKNWKFSFGDVEERKHWQQYMEAYEACLNATSTRTAPWYVVPADDKKNARLLIAEIILDTYKSMDMNYPVSDAKRQQELLAIREQLKP